MIFFKNPADNARSAKTPEEVAARLKEVFGEDMPLEIRERKAGKDDSVGYRDIWTKTDRERLPEFVDVLAEFDFPQFHIISGNDEGEAVSLHYLFTIFQAAGRGKRIGISVSVDVDKKDLVMPSLFSRIPGVEYSERETREMFGVDFDGLPNKALVFLPEEWDESVKPWRRDEAGPSAEDVRELS
ncbi:MAG: NADH-quinone oxidoreductase subunit C [Aminivibrio sp.]|jgi:membrane-bound hydrogenase subunit beta